MSFYLGRYAELYDLLYGDKPYADETRFVFDQIFRHGQSSSPRVLELACGTGNHAIELAKLGCLVTATDCSASMLEVACRKHADSTVEFSLCDMRKLPVPREPYDAAICLFDSIGYVQTDESLSAVFRGTRESLKPGGIFIFEFWHKGAIEKNYDPIRVKRLVAQGRTIIRIAETELLPDRCLAKVYYDVYELNADRTYERFSETQTNRYFGVAEMDAQAEKHRFQPLVSYSGFSTDEPITDETWHIVSVWRAI